MACSSAAIFDDPWSSELPASSYPQHTNGYRRSLTLHPTASPVEIATEENGEESKHGVASPKRSSVQLLVSPFTRKTSIRMVSESASRYSICIPTEDDESISPISLKSEFAHHDRNSSDFSIGSFIRNAFSSELDISLLEQADFSYTLSPTPDGTHKVSSSYTVDANGLEGSQLSFESTDASFKSRKNEDYTDAVEDSTLNTPVPTQRRSSIISLLTPRSVSPTNASTTSKSPSESTSKNTSKHLLPLGSLRNGSSLQSLSRQAIPKIQTEIAEPTFIRSRASTMNIKEVSNASSLCNNFIELGSDLMGFKSSRIKHFKSESDLLKLKDTLGSTESSSKCDVTTCSSETASSEVGSSQTTNNGSSSEKTALLRADSTIRSSSRDFEDDGLMTLLK